MRYEKSPYITYPGPPERQRFSSKGHMTLLISSFELTENPKEKELMGAKSLYIYIYIYIYIYMQCPVIMFDVNLSII